MEAVASLLFPSFPSPSLILHHHHHQQQQLFTPIISFPPLSFNSISTKQQLHLSIRDKRSLTALRSSSHESPSSTSSETWLLEPVGDGDSRHIGYNVPLPGAFEMASNVVTVGRLPGQADLVIPVATVSGVHARLKKKEGNLLVTDLDSTNGTFIDDKKLRPGAVAIVPPGSCVTYGDAHLAMFRVSKVKAAAETPTTEAEESAIEIDTPATNDDLETVS